MPWELGIAALVLALPGCINACFGLYDRFRPKPLEQASPSMRGLWAVRISNGLALILLGYIVASTWALPPRPAPAMRTASPAAPASPAHTKQAAKELYDASSDLLEMIQKIAHPLYEDWRGITVENPGRICIDLDAKAFRDRLYKLEERFRAAQNGMAAILERNSLDQSELLPLLGGHHGIQPPGFLVGIQGLYSYRSEIGQMGDHPACDTLIKSNRGPNAFVAMDRSLGQHATWLADTEGRLKVFRDSVHEEWRKAP